MKEKVKPYEGINLIHMMKCMMKQWYYIVVSMVLFGCLFGIYSYYKDKNSIENLTKDKIDDMSIQYESEEDILENSGLSSKAQQEVKFYTNKIFHYTEQYDKQKNYLDNSILMHMDPNEIWTITLYYDFIESTVDDGKVAAFIAKIVNSETYEEVEQTLNIDMESKYLSELIECDSTYKSNNLGQEEDINKSFDNDLKIVVKYSSKNGCETIANIIKKVIEKENKVQINKNSKYKLTLTSEQLVQVPDVELMKKQETEIRNLSNIANELVNTTTNIESTEKGTAEKLLDYYIIEKNNIMKQLYNKQLIVETNQGEENVEKISVRKPSINKKYVVLGLAIGFLIASGTLALLYFCSDRLKIPEEIESGYNLESISSGSITVAAIIIAEKCKKNKYSKIYLTSTVEKNRKELLDFSKAVNAQLLDTEKIDFVIDQNGILTDEKEPQYLANAEAVVLMEVCKLSEHKNIANVLQLIYALDKPVCGIVIM